MWSKGGYTADNTQSQWSVAQWQPQAHEYGGKGYYSKGNGKGKGKLDAWSTGKGKGKGKGYENQALVFPQLRLPLVRPR
jgi:hypothetical protein